MPNWTCASDVNFRMSEGFFLRLQDQYELLEAKRALNGELDRITPRAA